MFHHNGYLVGQLVVAMPQMQDKRFEHSVIFICAHNEEGAMGLVLNKEIKTLNFDDLLKQMKIKHDSIEDQIRIQFGGPVESGRGFVLHSNDYKKSGTLEIDSEISLTATIDILKSIASGAGPEKCFLALGYVGWGPGQLEKEIQDNGWLIAESSASMIFDKNLEDKWEKTIESLGISAAQLTGFSGQA